MFLGRLEVRASRSAIDRIMSRVSELVQEIQELADTDVDESGDEALTIAIALFPGSVLLSADDALGGEPGDT